jgi:hypothetical protein
MTQKGERRNHSLVNRASIHINPDEEGNCLQVTSPPASHAWPVDCEFPSPWHSIPANEFATMIQLSILKLKKRTVLSRYSSWINVIGLKVTL